MPRPSASATPDPSATPTAKPCVARDITVEALTDQDTYAAGQNPQLSIRLTNNGRRTAPSMSARAVSRSRS